MKRQILGLGDVTRGPANQVPDGLFLVRVDRVQYRWHAHKPFYILRLSVLSPSDWAGRIISGRLYCTPKALWKLGWFLRDFGYDSDLFGCDEIDEKALIGLKGVVKITHTTINGTPLLNLHAFAPASQWQNLSEATALNGSGQELAP